MAVKIFLDAGHGGKDSGATLGKRRESDDVLRLAKKIGERLVDECTNVKVGYSRTKDIYEKPSQKASDGNSFNADYFFSFHRNSYNGNARGWETDYKTHSTVKDGIMDDLNKHMRKIGFTIRGNKQRDDLAVLNQTHMPALLFEIGFIDNSSDNKIFDNNFDKIVDAFFNVFVKWCKLKKKSTENERRKEGMSYFTKNKNAANISEFLHNRNWGAGAKNLAMIAEANCESKEVKEALFSLAEKGLLIRPDGLNRWK